MLPSYIISSGPINIYITLGTLGWLLCVHFPTCSVPERANEDLTKLEGSPSMERMWFV